MKPAASEENLQAIELTIGKRLPNDLRAFLKWSGGGECKFQNIYIALWPTADIPELNNGYQIHKYLGEDVIGIGSDGGSISLLIDYRFSESPCFSSANFGDLDIAQIKILANSFTSLLESLINGTLTDSNIYP